MNKFYIKDNYCYWAKTDMIAEAVNHFGPSWEYLNDKIPFLRYLQVYNGSYNKFNCYHLLSLREVRYWYSKIQEDERYKAWGVKIYYKE